MLDSHLKFKVLFTSNSEKNKKTKLNFTSAYFLLSQLKRSPKQIIH